MIIFRTQIKKSLPGSLDLIFHKMSCLSQEDDKVDDNEIKHPKRTSVICKLSTICQQEDVLNHIHEMVATRTILGYYAAKLITAYVLHLLQDLQDPMPNITPLLDTAWKYVSNETKNKQSNLDSISIKHSKAVETRKRVRLKAQAEVKINPPKRQKLSKQALNRLSTKAKRKGKKTQKKKKNKDQEEKKTFIKDIDLKQPVITGHHLHAHFHSFATSFSNETKLERKYHRQNLTNYRQSARKEYETQASNNILVNFQTRTMKWILLHLPVVEKKEDETEEEYKKRKSVRKQNAHIIYDRGWFLQQPDVAPITDPLVLSLISKLQNFKKQYGIPQPIVPNLTRRWWLYLPWMHNLLQDFEKWQQEPEDIPKGLRLFNLLPQPSLQPHFIHISNSAAQRLAKALKGWGSKKTKRDRQMQQLPDGKDMVLTKEFLNDYLKPDLEKDIKERPWQLLFNVDQFPKASKGMIFADSIKTDGYSASVSMHNPCKSAFVSGEESNQKVPIPQEGARAVSIDPGRVSVITAVDNRGKTLEVSTKEYYHLAQMPKRRRILNKLQDTHKITEIIKNIPSSKTASFDDYMTHVKYVFEHAETMHSYWQLPIHKELRMEGYRLKTRALDRICQMITLGDKNTIVAYGAAKFSHASAGHQSSCGGILKRRLKQHTKRVVEVDEHLTSQLCPRCSKELKEEYEGKRMKAPVYYVKGWTVKLEHRQHRRRATRSEEKKKARLGAEVSAEERRTIKKTINAKHLEVAQIRWKDSKEGKSKVEGVREQKGERKAYSKCQKVRLTKEEWKKEKKEYEEKEKKEEEKAGVKYRREEIRGVRHCQCCQSFWNRDIAAALNIMYLYECMAQGLPRPILFTPNNKKPDP